MAYVKNGQPAQGSTHPNLGNDESADGIISNVTIGEAVSFSNLLYQNSDGKYYKALANSQQTMPVKAIACWTSPKANIVIPVLKQGFIRNDAWSYMQGSKLYVSDTTAGAITPSAPSDYRQEIGEVDRTNVIYFNPEANYHYGSSERTTIKDLQTDVDGIYERQQPPYICKIWGPGYKPIIKLGRHVRLKVMDASVVVGDNTELSQTIEIVGITSPIDISTGYAAGSSIPLSDYIIRDTIGLNEEIEVYASGSRRVTVELICESDE